MVNPATSTARWKRHKQQNALALWGFAILCEWRTIGPRCKVSAWLLTDLCMPSPRQARLGTLPSLSFSPISSTNLLGAMKELNSFATLSLPKCHYHNVLRRPTVSTGSMLIVFFMGSWRQASADIHRALAAALVLSMSDKKTFVERSSEVLSVLELLRLMRLCSLSCWCVGSGLKATWRHWSESRGSSRNIWRVDVSDRGKDPDTFIRL